MRILFFIPRWMPDRVRPVYIALVRAYPYWRSYVETFIRRRRSGSYRLQRTMGPCLRVIARTIGFAKAIVGELLALLRDHGTVRCHRGSGRRPDTYRWDGDYPERISYDAAWARLSEPQRPDVPRTVPGNSSEGTPAAAPTALPAEFFPKGGGSPPRPEPPVVAHASPSALQRLKRTILGLVVRATCGPYDREARASHLDSGTFLNHPTIGLQIHAILRSAGVLDHEPTRAKLALRLSREGWDPEGLAVLAVEIIRAKTVVYPPSFLYYRIHRMLQDGIKTKRPLVRRLQTVDEAIGWRRAAAEDRLALETLAGRLVVPEAA